MSENNDLKQDIQKSGIIYVLSPQVLNKRKTKKLDQMIYKNFIHIADNPILMHNYKEIKNILSSNDVQFYLYFYKNKILGYLVGTIMKLSDGRRVFYITYIYVAKDARQFGIGNKLLNFAKRCAANMYLDGIMLTCDTENKKVYSWYTRHGFMLDMQLRKYERYDVLYNSNVF